MFDQKKYSREYYWKNRDRLLEYTRNYIKTHPEQVRLKKAADYQANREEILRKSRVYREKNRDRIRAFHKSRTALGRAVMDGELARGCVDCGEKDFRVLDFDHVRGKSFTIGSSPRKAIAVLYAEIDRCEVRCANCHRRMTYERRKAKAS